MHISVIRGGDLGAHEVEHWRAIRDGSADLSSPFFDPAFALVVAAERDDLFIAIVDDQGFFPFHRDQNGAGKPLGIRIADYHGVIAAASADWSAKELLRACNLHRWDYRSVPLSQKLFEPYHTMKTRSLLVDLAGGFDAYSEQLRSGLSHVEKRVRAMRRQLEKKVGPIEFTWHSDDREDFQRLLACKSNQYERTGTADIFALPWIVNVLRSLQTAQQSTCRGVLSVLRAGGHRIAAHFGVRSRDVLHYWFPCYWQAYAQYSPGLILLFDLTRHAAAEGISTIDLGFGKGAYKERFANAKTDVARGALT